MYQPPGQRADLRQLTRIRVAIAALQLLVVWAASLWVELRVWTLTGLITLGLLSSGLVLVGGAAPGARHDRAVIAGALLLDIGVLAGLLYFSGGPTNPASVVFLVYIALAAIMLGSLWAWFDALLSVGLFGALFFWHQPLALFDGQHGSHTQHAAHHAAHHGAHHADPTASAFDAHLVGMWFSFSLTAALIAYAISWLARTLRSRERELASVRGRSERLAALTSLAAGAAHELGTPLGTIALVSRELELELEQNAPDPRWAEDARLMRQEVERCRNILASMSQAGGEVRGEPYARLPVADLLRDVTEALSDERRGRLDVRASGDIVLHGPRAALTTMLLNLVRNAFDASGPDDRVQLQATSDARYVQLSVVDQGRGMDADELKRARDPFFTTKPPGTGMGLGLYLADALLDAIGGALTLHSTPGEGTHGQVALPLRPE